MATETLYCEAGDHNFQRELVRGRKPKTCPDCKGTPKKNSGSPKNGKAKDNGPLYLHLGEVADLPEPDEEFTVGNITRRKYAWIEDSGGLRVSAGDRVQVEGRSGTFVVRHYVEPDNDTEPYFDLVGESKDTLHKYYTIGASKVIL